MSFHVLIPARLASSRLPNKPLADIAGLPMVVRVARQAALSTAASVTVAADSPAILEACAVHGVAALATREDHPSGSDRLAEACERLALPDDAIVVNVQGDEPLIDPALINDCAAALTRDPQCVMSTVAHSIDAVEDWLNPNVVKVVLDRHGRALYFSRSPLPAWRDRAPGAELGCAPSPVWRHVGLYAYRAGFLKTFPRLEASPLERAEMLEQLRVLWHGHSIAVHTCAQAPGAGVDTPEDLERVRRLLAVPA